MAKPSERTLAAPEAVASQVRPIARLLALEIRPQRVGFVVFEGAASLLDWGVRGFVGEPSELTTIAAKKIGLLLDIYTPVAIAAREVSERETRTKQSRQSVLAAIRIAARVRSVKFHRFSEKKIRRFFSRQGCETKHQIASALAERFGSLSWKLPPKRKPWQSQHYNSVIFDAAATGVAFLGTEAFQTVEGAQTTGHFDGLSPMYELI
jgi:hypothetical protein